MKNEPAFPVYTEDMPVEGTPGMSKRFYAACKAMEGILSSLQGTPPQVMDAHLVERSFTIADEMLKQEEENQ
jgi:hypothetical protein